MRPLLADVLCAPASKVGRKSFDASWLVHDDASWTSCRCGATGRGSVRDI
jgi:hypothetical protein